MVLWRGATDPCVRILRLSYAVTLLVCTICLQALLSWFRNGAASCFCSFESQRLRDRCFFLVEINSVLCNPAVRGIREVYSSLK